MKQYRCITPKTIDELAPPGVDEYDEDSRTITVVSTQSANDNDGLVVNKLTSSHSTLTINGDLSEFMEKCFPDYRLRVESKAQGWSITCGDMVIRGGILTIGSQPTGLCLEVNDDSLIEQLNMIITLFTPAQSDSISNHLCLQRTSSLLPSPTV